MSLLDHILIFSNVSMFIHQYIQCSVFKVIVTIQQVYETKLKTVSSEIAALKEELLRKQQEADDLKCELQNVTERLTSEYEALKVSKEAQLQDINSKLENNERMSIEKLNTKEMHLNQTQKHAEELEIKFNELVKVKDEEIKQLNSRMTEKAEEKQVRNLVPFRVKLCVESFLMLCC